MIRAHRGRLFIKEQHPYVNGSYSAPSTWYLMKAGCHACPCRIFPSSVQSYTWQRMNDLTKGWSYSTLANSSVWWNIDIHVKKDGVPRFWVMACSPHTVFIFLHQSDANKTHRSSACQASEDVISVCVTVILAVSEGQQPGRGREHIRSCVRRNLAAVLKRTKT